MPQLCKTALAICLGLSILGLSILVSTASQATFITQNPANPLAGSREAGSQVLAAISEIYGTVAQLERQDLENAQLAFGDLSDRLRDLSEEYEDLAQDLNGIEPIDDNWINERTSFPADRTFGPGSPARWTLGLDSLSMPNTKRDVFLQAQVVLQALATRVQEAGILSSSNVGVADVEQFRSLNDAVWEALNIMTLHSIMLSTVR